MTATALLAAPEGYDAHAEAAHISDVVRYLLMTYPNTVIGYREVGDVVGYDVPSSTVGMAVRRLRSSKRRGSFAPHIMSALGRGGGHVLIVPVPATGAERCACCPHHTRAWTCRLMRQRPIEPDLWCWGWGR